MVLSALDLPRLKNPLTTKLEGREKRFVAQSLYLLMAIFAGVLMVGAIALFIDVLVDGGVWTNARDYLQVAVPAVTGLLGSAMGFYFGRLR
jgi:hypothetical protein